MLEIGSSLREARRRQGLELAEVERATRIRMQQLDALEHDRFELLPPDPYRRAFLREYADFLGLDGDLYAREYDLRFRPTPEAAPAPPRRRRGSRARLLAGRPLLRAGGILLVVLVGVVAWQFGRPGGSGTLTPTAHTQTRAQARPHSHERAASKPPASGAAASLVLTAARGRCWLWVRLGSATGATVYEQTLQPGQTVRFGLGRSLWIRLGAPWSLDASIGHRPLTLPSQTGDVLATAAGLQPTP